MSRNTIRSVRAFDRRFELPEHGGSDSMHPDPVYSFAVTLIELGDGEFGTGLAYTLGRGNEVVVRAIEAYAPMLIGRDLNDIMRRFARSWRALADDSQLRWIGPHKGVIHLALSSIMTALLDAWARRQRKPLWQLLLDMTPDELVDWIDFGYLDDYLTREEALDLLGCEPPAMREGHPLLSRGYPAYNTAVGWLGFDLEQLVANCKSQVDEGFSALKLKVGAPRLEDDLERISRVREAVGPDVRLMTDANQRWSVPQAITAGRALARLGCYWLEEPTHPDDVLGYQEIARSVAPLKLASGENVSNAVLFKNLIRGGGIHFVQADVTRLGGLPEWLAVALMAKKAGLPLVPHAGDMGQVHQHLVLWRALALGEEPDPLEYIPYIRAAFETPIQVERGAYRVPSEPGASTRMAGLSP
jgi:L-fuconate dehydratase